MNETTVIANMDELKAPSRKLDQDDWLDCIAEEIDELPETERLIISLFYYEGLTIKEIALVLEMPEWKVSRIRYDTMLGLLKR